jgi:hypothetical protein
MYALPFGESFFLLYFYRFVYHWYNSFLSDCDANPDAGSPAMTAKAHRCILMSNSPFPNA